ncbi:MAG: SWIM zinc finger family protein [Acutalibacteraceae bacterium]
MQALIDALENADDDYLIGLSNKGILKRSYKDLQEAEISAEYGENSAEMTVAEEKCTIVVPLGESKCSCPSRSICRHIITAILWLKQNKTSSEKKDTETADEPKELQPELKDELSAFPLKTLQKAMKKSYYAAFITDMEKNRLPQFSESSILSVSFPKDNINVRLVYPLEHSTCTCHSKELCQHKAAAILAWQFNKKIVTLDTLKTPTQTAALNIPIIHHTAETVFKFLSNILSGGLVRLSDDTAEQTESMAILCHNNRLADLERLLREMGNRLDGYLKHAPEFRSDMLFALILDCIVLAKKILKADNNDTLLPLLGEMKSTYTVSDDLALIPIAKREFSSVSGYEGEIYYFLNKDTESPQRFFSYSNIRPSFYDTRKVRPLYNAPWGLGVNVDEMMKFQIRLKNPKLSGSKISSSGETTGELTEPTEQLNLSEVRDCVYTDFKKMIEDVFSSTNETETERLVFLSPKKYIQSVSDTIGQAHRLIIEDTLGQRITIQLHYRSSDKNFFDTFRALCGNIVENTKDTYVFFGRLYIEHEKCYLFPIAVFNTITLSPSLEEKEIQRLEGNDTDYGYFAELFHDIQKTLGDIMQCGINSFDLYDSIQEYALECQKCGLNRLNQKLDALYNCFIQRNHTYDNDNTNIVRLLTEIHQYLLVGIQKTEIRQAINNLMCEEE